MALSTQTVVSDGTLALLDISIEYLDRSEITVYFNSAPQSTGWAWVGLTEKQISFSPAVPAGTEVLIKRTTVLSDLRHEFSLGAAFTAQFLDEALRQVLHVTQEAKEANFSADFYTALNLHTNQIKFLADPTDAQDAVTKAWAETAMSSQLSQATTQANNALASADAADASEAAALSSKNAAELAASNAKTSETNAAASATAANDSKTAAAQSETNAAASANASASSANAAAASYDSFDDRYLGSKDADPTLDNDGAALLVGALYYNTALSAMRVYNGAAWDAPAAIASGALYAANNLSDVANAATALSNIGGQPLNATLTAISGDTLLPTIADGSMGAFSHRNRIINGGFSVNQRGLTSVADDSYCLDRWYALTEVGNVTIAQQTLQENGTPYNIRLTQPDATAKLVGLAQIIEHSNCADLRAKNATQSLRVRNSDGGQINYAVLEWSGTADTVTSDFISVWAASPTYIASITERAKGTITPTANTWTDAAAITAAINAAANNVIVFIWSNAAMAQNATLDIARVQLEEGSIGTAFEHRHVGAELALCQRYYWQGLPAKALNYSAYVAGAFGSWAVAFPVQMRVTPTAASDFTGVVLGDTNAPTWDQVAVDGGRLIASSTVATTNANFSFAAGNYVSASAEL